MKSVSMQLNSFVNLHLPNCLGIITYLSYYTVVYCKLLLIHSMLNHKMYEKNSIYEGSILCITIKEMDTFQKKVRVPMLTFIISFRLI